MASCFALFNPFGLPSMSSALLPCRLKQPRTGLMIGSQAVKCMRKLSFSPMQTAYTDIFF